MPGRKASKASRSWSPTASGGAIGIVTWPVPRDHLPEEPKYTIDPHTFAVTAVGAEKERLLAEDEKLRRGAEEREQRRRKLKRAA